MQLNPPSVFKPNEVVRRSQSFFCQRFSITKKDFHSSWAARDLTFKKDEIKTCH